MSRRLHIGLLVGAALAIRLLAWWTLPYVGLISDEAEYLAAATWLANGRGFAFFDGWIWTRPPLYVTFLAAHIAFWGPTILWPIRVTQALLGALTAWQTLRLAERLAGADATARPSRAALLAGWAVAVSPSLASFAFFLLSETLFIALLLAGLLALLAWRSAGRRRDLLLGGVLLGLAALTRGLLVFWLPLVALWVARAAWPGGRRHAARQVAGLALAVSAVVLPWSAYATARYGGLVLVDTTGGYNFMLGAQAAHLEQIGAPYQRKEKEIYDELRDIAPHAARQRHAYARGLEWVAENPAGFVRKAGRELLDLLQLSYGGAERLSDGYTLGRVPVPHLLALLLDDTLYVLALPLAALGLLRRPPAGLGAGRWLIVSWLLFNLLSAPLFFAINRFRVPLLPLLFIYAGLALAGRREPWAGLARKRGAWALAIGLLLVVLPSYLWWPFGGGRRATLEDTRLGLVGVGRAADCAAVEAALDAGDLARARQLHDAADARSGGTDCLALLHARLLDQTGQPAAALALLRTMRAIPERYLMEGDILRRQGDIAAARGAFVAQQLEPQNPDGWAWEHLRPPPTASIDLGSGLDWGYVRGFYGREPAPGPDPFGPGTFRWLGDAGSLRFVAAGTGQPQTLRLRVSGYRSAGDAPAHLVVSHAGQVVWQGLVAPAWQEISAPLAATPAGRDVVVELASSVAIPDPAELAARQQGQARQPLRLLGVQVDWAELK